MVQGRFPDRGLHDTLRRDRGRVRIRRECAHTRRINHREDHAHTTGEKNTGSHYDGLFALQTIGSSTSSHTAGPWINKYIFPNGVIPSARQITTATEGLWVMERWWNLGPHYDPTLMAWHRNFEAHWDELSATYDERFRRMWRYYLLSCAGNFRARRNQVWQIVYSHDGMLGGHGLEGPVTRPGPK